MTIFTLDTISIAVVLTAAMLSGLAVWFALQGSRVDPTQRERYMLSLLPDAVLIIDDILCIVDANPAATCLLHGPYDQGMLLEKALPELITALANDEEQLKLKETVYGIEQYPLNTGTMIVLHDVTKWVQKERTLQKQIEQLEKQNASLDNFTQTVAHDLQAPVSLVIGYSDIVLQAEDDEVSAEYKEFALRIKAAGSNMGDMVKNLLLLAHVADAGKKVGPVDMNTTAQRAVARFSFELEQRQIEIDVSKTMPEALAHGPWVEEVYANLISNAIKYIGKDNAHPAIRLTARHYGTHIRYEVRDNGIGIAPENREKLWDMFARFDRTEAVGMGIGLSIVMRTVSKLNGEVGLESKLGEGSTFWFTLPAYMPCIVAA